MVGWHLTTVRLLPVCWLSVNIERPSCAILKLLRPLNLPHTFNPLLNTVYPRPPLA
jgi:hypothetical protein